VPDQQVQTALGHWAPRCIQNGVDYNDFMATTARVSSWEEWLPQWSRTADQAAAAAEDSEARGHLASAGNSWLRAAITRHFGKFVWVLDPQLHAEATLRAVDELRNAHRLLDPSAERIEAPLGQAKVVGNLRRPAGERRPPLVILIPGLDSTKEEFFRLEQSFLDRGMATLSMDGAGQGEVGLSMAISHDYETSVAAMLDALVGRDDLDLDRIGIFGVSLGGYYAPRVAAFEPRARAVVGLAGPFNFGDIWDSLPPFTRATFVLKAHVDSDAAGHERASELDLEGVCERISVPALFMTGKLDGIVPWEQTARIAERTPGAEFINYEDGNHGCSNLSYKARPALADWMRDRLDEVTA
jgi:pimeloyl-ACP methyl ester carboxylesterase